MYENEICGEETQEIFLVALPVVAREHRYAAVYLWLHFGTTALQARCVLQCMCACSWRFCLNDDNGFDITAPIAFDTAVEDFSLPLYA